MFNQAIKFVATFFAITTLILFGIAYYFHYMNKTKKEEIIQLKRKNETQVFFHKVKLLEEKQKIEFKFKKGVKDENISSNIGIHAISL